MSSFHSWRYFLGKKLQIVISSLSSMYIIVKLYTLEWCSHEDAHAICHRFRTDTMILSMYFFATIGKLIKLVHLIKTYSVNCCPLHSETTVNTSIFANSLFHNFLMFLIYLQVRNFVRSSKISEDCTFPVKFIDFCLRCSHEIYTGRFMNVQENKTEQKLKTPCK